MSFNNLGENGSWVKQWEEKEAQRLDLVRRWQHLEGYKFIKDPGVQSVFENALPDKNGRFNLMLRTSSSEEKFIASFIEGHVSINALRDQINEVEPDLDLYIVKDEREAKTNDVYGVETKDWPGLNKNKLFLGNFDVETIILDDLGRATGYAHLNFLDEQSAQACMQEINRLDQKHRAKVIVVEPKKKSR